MKWAFNFISSRKKWTESDERKYYISRYLKKNLDKHTQEIMKQEEEEEEQETQAEMNLFDSVPKYHIISRKPPRKGTCKC